MHRYLLVLRFALVDLTSLGILAAIYLQGWLDNAVAGYTGWLSLGIGAVFVYGLALCGAKIWWTGRELNDIGVGAPKPKSRAQIYLETIAEQPADSRNLSANLLHLRFTNQISIVRHTANTLVFLGLVGTVIGFIVALSAVDPQATTQVENVAPMVSRLIEGMSIALYTTLVGAVLHVWLMVNHRTLATGTIHLFNAIVELGERRVGA